MAGWNNLISLDCLIKENKVSLDRGRVISSIDLNNYPGDYPVYSSSAQKNGYFGSFGKYDFDEELITWSVDGGGHFFYRPKHKFSVTNVSGLLRILDKDKLDYKFLYYLLAFQHKNQIFDYVDKAHPSVIKKRYYIPELDLRTQIKIAEVLSAIDHATTQTETLIAKYNRIKIGLMQDLLTKGIDEEGNIRSEATHEFWDSTLGRIPKEWDVEYLGVLISEAGGFIQTGPFGSQLHAHEYVTEGIPVIMPQDIVLDRIDNTYIAKITESKANNLARHKVKNGDLIFARRGDLSKCAVINSDYEGSICGTGCLLIHHNQNIINSNWLANIYQFHPFQVEISISAVGSTMPNLNTEILNNLKIYKVSKEEQDRIIAYLDKIDDYLLSNGTQLSKLQSVKTGLMQDLLTGKVKVTK